MKFFLALSTVILAVSAVPAHFVGEIDPSRQPSAFTTNTNFSNARVPWGQAGFAATSGGTHGGNGGAIWTVWDPWALQDALRGNDRREISVRGRIDLTQLFTGSPGVALDVGSFKSIYGGDSNAIIFGGGLKISQVHQVIVENIKFYNALSYAPGEQPNGNGGIISMVPGPWSWIDNLGIETADFVWVNHCEFADDPWNALNTPGDMRRHDGLIDITSGANWISISNSIFRNHNLVSLVGNDDSMVSDRNRLKVTWYHNWFQGTIQRNPRVRFGEVHVVNNLYTDIRDYGIGIGTESTIYSERNAFFNTRRAWGWAFMDPWTPGSPPPTNARAYYMDVGNRLVNSGYDTDVPSHGVTWRPYQYYQFSAMNATEVEAYVRRHAGTR